MNNLTAGRGVTDLRVSEGELVLLNNALNEVCNGVDFCDAEFQTRLGVPREQARILLARIGATLDSAFKATS